MRKILLYLLGVLSIFSPALIKAQSFTFNKDTVTAPVSTSATVYNNITIPGSSPVTVKWHVIASDFPADWLTPTAFGICDGSQCRNNLGDTLLWNAATSSGPVYQCTYPGGAIGTFDLTPDLTAATSTGCHYVSVLVNEAVPLGDSKVITFVICKSGLNVPGISGAENNMILYPNPASNEINVVYDVNAGVKNMAVYSIIGKVMSVYKVTGNSANLNIENIPSGVYFVRAFNSNGNVVATRKFTKQ
jgi:hypothetical protein